VSSEAHLRHDSVHLIGDLLRRPSGAIEVDRFLDEYEASQWLDERRLREHQLAGLRRLVWHTAQHVPRFAGEMARRMPVSGVVSLEDLPVQRAVERRRRPEAFVAEGVAVGVQRCTAGTRGPRQQVIMNPEAHARQIAVRRRVERWAGAPPARVVAAWGRDASREPRPLDHEQLDAFAYALGLARTVLVSAPASSYRALSTVSELQRVGLRGLIARGEQSDGAIATLAERLGVPLYSWYIAAEVGVIAAPCERAVGLHVQADHLLVEVVDEHGRPLPDGESGRILVTDLHNEAAPYLRHELGDIGRLLPDRCPCGRALPLLELVGRCT
jgi:phenylacetate-CoA ligase